MSERAPRRFSIWLLALPAGVALVMSGVVVGRSSARSTTTIIQHEAEQASSSDSNDRRLTSLEEEVARLRAERLALSRKDAPAKPDEEVAKSEPAPSKPAPEEDEPALEERRAQFLDGALHSGSAPRMSISEGGRRSGGRRQISPRV